MQAQCVQKTLDFALLHIGAHNVYYVKYDMDIREEAINRSVKTLIVAFPLKSMQ
ncbi:hypothetical protein L370_03573 [Enterobacter sp. MGH 24]|nr:hypothetical protein L370_03573 [Enterobacter sp. MGH 24]